jgi:DNA-binding transcriptional LysR family regulator
VLASQLQTNKIYLVSFSWQTTSLSKQRDLIESPTSRDRIIDACRSAGFEPEIDTSIRSGGIITLLSLVTTGLGLSILPSHVQILHREGIVYRSIRGLDLCRHITVVWRKDDSSPALKSFLNLVQPSIKK